MKSVLMPSSIGMFGDGREKEGELGGEKMINDVIPITDYPSKLTLVPWEWMHVD